MKYRRLGKTELDVSEISLGTWQLGGGWGQPFDTSKAFAVLEAALTQGINLLDTADVYSDQKSEKAVGQLVSIYRDDLYIATKIGRRLNPHVASAYTPKALHSFVDDALANTGLEYLDLVQLHCPPTAVYQQEEIFKTLEDIKASGRVRHFGVSVELVEEAISACQYPVVETVQIIYNMFRQKPAGQCFDLLKQHDIGIIARVPLASGLLTGKINQNTRFDASDHRQFNRNGELFDKGETFSGVPLDLGFPAVEALKALFPNANLASIALKWVLMHPLVSTVIPGASSPDQVKLNAGAADFPALSTEEIQGVKRIYDKYIAAVVENQW